MKKFYAKYWAPITILYLLCEIVYSVIEWNIFSVTSFKLSHDVMEKWVWTVPFFLFCHIGYLIGYVIICLLGINAFFKKLDIWKI